MGTDYWDAFCEKPVAASLCLTEPMPDSSSANLPLAKAQPTKSDGNDFVVTFKNEKMLLLQ